MGDKSLPSAQGIGQGLPGAVENRLTRLRHRVSLLSVLLNQATQHFAEFVALGLDEINLFALAERGEQEHRQSGATGKRNDAYSSALAAAFDRPPELSGAPRLAPPVPTINSPALGLAAT